MFNEKPLYARNCSKEYTCARHQGLTTLILTIQEEEIRRIMV
jgi:hypothetical protein